ncbi:MAG: MAPEG family protein [Gammaproteobacteria bacterium]|nr:MAPEG family protein [Gammaproteobacteria bacterium]
MQLINPEPILLPIISLVIRTFVMQTWLIIARIPAMQAVGLTVKDAERTAELGTKLPKEAQWKADNYNHLLEQPTIFYATALALAMIGAGDGLNLWLAWI